MKYSNPGADFPCGVETGSTGSNPVLNARINNNDFQGCSLQEFNSDGWLQNLDCTGC